MKLLIKICGLTNAEDARVALDAGADALGFVFAPRSPRCVSRAAVAAITRLLPSEVRKVGVFVDATREEILATCAECGLNTIQLHGAEPPEFCASFPGLTVWKAFRVRDAESLRALPAFQTDAWLLDSFVPGQSGGTGARFDWELAVAARALGRPVILAGGLTAENAFEAIRQTRPFGVDVSSGVEIAPGRKDHAKVRAFIAAARAAALALDES